MTQSNTYINVGTYWAVLWL